MIVLRRSIYLSGFLVGSSLWISPCSECPSEGGSTKNTPWDTGDDALIFPLLFFSTSHKLTSLLVQLRLRIVAVCYFSSSVCCQHSTLFLLKGWNFPLIIQSSHWIHGCLTMMCIALAMGIYDFLISFSFQSILFLCDFCCTWGKCGGLKLYPFSNGCASVSVKRPR